MLSNVNRTYHILVHVVVKEMLILSYSQFQCICKECVTLLTNNVRLIRGVGASLPCRPPLALNTSLVNA